MLNPELEAKLAALDPATLIATYMRYRGKKAALVDDHNKAVAAVDIALEAIEAHVLGRLTAQNVESYKTAAGTAYKKEETRVSLVDRLSLIDYVQSTDDFDIFTNAVSKDRAKAILKETNSPPPGVEITRFYGVGFRKPTTKD